MSTKLKALFAPGVKFTALDWLTLMGPSTVLSSVSIFAGIYFNYITVGGVCAIGFPLIWAAMLFSMGYNEVGARDYIVVERFGNFHTVLFGGIVWTNPFFDETEKTGDFKTRQFRLYADDPDRAEIDFTDGSAPVAITAAYSVGHPEDFAEGNWAALTEAVREYTYRYSEAVKRIDTVLDGAVRPLLQRMSIDDAQRGTDEACAIAADNAASSLALFGVYQPGAHAIVVEDIDLPKHIKDARELPLIAQKAADGEKLRLTGPARGILAVRDALREAGMEMGDEQIVSMLMTQQGLQTLKETGANVSLYGFDIKSLLESIGVKGKGD